MRVKSVRSAPNRGAAFQVTEQVRVGGIGLVEDRRHGARLGRGEHVHAEAHEPARVLRIVLAVVVRILVALRRRTVFVEKVVPVGAERAVDLFEVGRQRRRERTEGFAQLGHRVGDERERGFFVRGVARGLELGAGALHLLGRALHFVGELLLGLGQGALGGLVEHGKLLGADRLAVQDRKRLHAALDGTNAEAERLGAHLEPADQILVVALELAGELGLRGFDGVEILDGRDLAHQVVDEIVHRRREPRAFAGRQQVRTRGFRPVEVVHVDDVRRRAATFEVARREAHEVVLDHHLRLGGDEHVERRFASQEAERERALRRRRRELEEAAARIGHGRQRSRIGVQLDQIGRHPRQLARVVRDGVAFAPRRLVDGGLTGSIGRHDVARGLRRRRVPPPATGFRGLGQTRFERLRAFLAPGFRAGSFPGRHGQFCPAYPFRARAIECFPWKRLPVKLVPFMARLILATPDSSGASQVVDLLATNSLGRHPSNSIQLLDKIVSKEHCIVEQRGAAFWLRDLGSLNGTYVNGERVRGEQILRHGDDISLGATRARYDDGSGAPMGPPRNAQQPYSPQPQQVAPPYVPPPMRAPMQSSPTNVPRTSVPPPTSMQPAPGSAAGYSRPPGSDGAFRAPQGSSPRFPQQPPPPVHGTPAHGTQALPQMQYAQQQHQPQPRPGQYPQPRPPLPQPQRPPASGPGQPRPPTLMGTRVDLLDSARAIERQIAARTKGFLPYEQIAVDPKQLGFDYERLRLTWELSRDIALERDLDTLLEKILKGMFKFVKADRGVALLKEPDGTLQPRVAHRRDGTEAPIEVSQTILNHVMKEKASVLTHDASSDFAASKGKSMILNRISSAMVVPLLHEQEVLGALWLDSAALAQFQEKDLEVVTTVAGQAAMFVENILLTKKIEHEITTRERFSRLLSPNVAEQVISGKLEIKKGGVQIPHCTVFNSDIRGFTSMSEGTSAEMMVEILNEYFEQMVETIFKYEGTLDKFMGDGIMAFWGAPVAHGDDAIRAVDSALEQMEVLRQFNAKRAELSLPPLAIGMGVHTGPLVAGYVGSSKALSYTVIGDTANTSARLCGIALSGQILVSEATLGKLGDRFEYQELAPAALKGKEKPLRIFNVLSRKLTAIEAAPSVRSLDAL